MKDKTIALTAAQVLQVRKELDAIWAENQRKVDEQYFLNAIREYEEIMVNEKDQPTPDDDPFTGISDDNSDDDLPF